MTCFIKANYPVKLEFINSYATEPQKNNFIYWNDYAVSLAKLGKINQAKTTLNHPGFENLTIGEKSVKNATLDLIEFRAGNAVEGRKLYNIAINEFENRGELISTAIATYYLAFEEKHINSEEADKRIKQAKERLGKFNYPVYKYLAKML